MQLKLIATNINKLQPGTKPYEVRDTEIKGFILRVQPTGVMIYYLDYRLNGKRNRYRIGSHGTIKPNKARDIAEREAGKVANSVDVQKEKQSLRRAGEKAKLTTLKGFLENKYGPWVTAHRKSGDATLQRIKNQFDHLMSHRLENLSPWVIEKWRTERKKQNIADSTINRDLVALKAALSKALEWELIDQHPLHKVKPFRIDTAKKVRYLSAAEEQSLRKALDEREARVRRERKRGNKWRKERGYDLYPLITKEHFVDHLKPMVLLSLNSGMRRGELFNLKWPDVDLKNKQVTISGETAKSGKTRHIPLNQEALETLTRWKPKKKEEATGYVFPGKEGQRLDNVSTSWQNITKKAKLKDFRWHDMRHHFASKLVMASVDLNTVRELLGHSDLKMTLRYAHLAPEHKAAAVEKIGLYGQAKR